MSLAGASDGLYGALVGGGFSTLLFWLDARFRRKGLAEAWQKQVGDLYRELNEQHEREVAYLRGQLTAKDESLERARDRLTGGVSLEKTGGTDDSG